MARYKLKTKTRQKNFGWTFGLRELNRAATGIAKDGKTALTAGQRIQTGLAGAAKLGGTAALATGAVVGTKKAWDGATGESAAKQMEFSNKIRFKRKTYSEEYKQVLQMRKEGKLAQGAGKDMLNQLKTQNAANTAQQEAARQAHRAATSNAAVQQVAQKASEQGFQRGAKSVGFKQGAINTWNKMGTAGKVGTAAAGIAAAGLMAKGLFGGSKKENQ